MVSDAQLNAKIDSQSGHVILGVQPPDVYQQVPTHTHTLPFPHPHHLLLNHLVPS